MMFVVKKLDKIESKENRDLPFLAEFAAAR